MSFAGKYELEMLIKEGTHGHPKKKAAIYVEVSVAGVTDAADQTELVQLENGRAVWNKYIVKRFPTLEPTMPTIISLSMYKKRNYLGGFKLIGTAHFSISELIPILNKDTVQGRIKLNMKRDVPSTSSFLVAMKLKSFGDPSPRSETIRSSLPFIPEKGQEEDFENRPRFPQPNFD